ncbi:MAG: hypothetical protein ACE5D8_06275 [Fidelibacterota bacterium]
MIRWVAFLLCLSGVSFSQLDRRYQPDDWILFTQPGRITSISEGLSYIYFASALGGIQRYQYYAGEFDFPITVAQGLPENAVEAVHFDKNTGILWVVTRKYICYSYDRIGDWYYQSKEDYGFPANTPVIQLGHDSQSLWVVTPTMIYQLDHNGGVLLGVMPSMDPLNIVWSSSPLRTGEPLPEFLLDFAINDGWTVFPDRFLDHYGRDIVPTAIFQQEFGEIWIGTAEGFILKVDIQSETIFPLRVGLANNDVNLIVRDKAMWLAGNVGRWSRGITRFSWKRNFTDWYEYDVTINLSPVNYYTGLAWGNEIWFVGNSVLEIYNKKNDFWRMISPMTFGRAYTIKADSATIWIGLSTGAMRLNPKTKRIIAPDILDRLEQRPVYDIEFIRGNVWFATDEGIYVYNPINETLQPGDAFESEMRCLMFPTWQIGVNNDSVYVANNHGLWLWAGNQCELIISLTSFHNRPVTTFAIVDHHLFIGTTDGFYRMNKDGSGYYSYNYPFVKPVNDMYISDEECWLATNHGLVRFNWRSDP